MLGVLIFAISPSAIFEPKGVKKRKRWQEKRGPNVARPNEIAPEIVKLADFFDGTLV